MAFNRNLQGLRGACAFAIVIFHIYSGAREKGWIAPPHDAAERAFDFGLMSLNTAVDLFFMISGYLMIGAFRRSRGMKDFAIARLVRVYPVFFVTTSLILIIGPFVHYKYLANANLSGWLYYSSVNLLFLANAVHLQPVNLVVWSLSYEIAFYISLALLIALSARLRPPAYNVIFLAGVSGAVAIFPKTCSFIAGALVYRYFEGRAMPALLKSSFVEVPLVIALFVILESARQTSDPGTMYCLTGLGFVVSVPVFLGLVRGETAATKLLRMAPAQYLGKISYSLYLWHLIVLYPAKLAAGRLLPGASPAAHAALFAAICLPPAILTAAISYHLLEAKLVDLYKGRRLGAVA